MPGYVAVIFVGGSKSDDTTSPFYVPTFDHIKSPAKKNAECQLANACQSQ